MSFDELKESYAFMGRGDILLKPSELSTIDLLSTLKNKSWIVNCQ